MIHIHRTLLLLVVSAFLLLSACAQKEGRTAFSRDGLEDLIRKPPRPHRWVQDLDTMLSMPQRVFLEKRLEAWDRETGNQLAVVIVPALYGMDLDSASLALARNWGIGRQDRNNGLLIFIARKERKVRIQTGYGLESLLTDEKAKMVLDSLLTPSFKMRQYFEGLDKVTAEMIRIVDNK